jgi:hypothetical protein
MGHAKPPSTPRERSGGTTLAKILMTIGLIGTFWLLFTWNSIGSTSAPSGTIQADAGEPWPSVPATFTPVPTPAAVLIPTPTPIPLPPPKVVSEWAVIAFTLASNQTAGGEDKYNLNPILGEDAVTIRVVGRVTVGIPVDQIETQLVAEPDGRAITMHLPALQVTSVEILPEQTALLSVSRRRWLSEYSGLELQAVRMGYNDLYNQVANNPEMLELATDVARLKVADHLRNLGFSDITITTTNATQGGQE